MNVRRTLFALIVSAAAALPALANITSASLQIQGAELDVVDTPIVVGIDMPSTVQTKFGGKMNAEAVALDGVVAVGDLTGPGLETPIQLTTAPGYKFQIPGLSQKGDYLLQNVRLMKGTEFLQYATHGVVKIRVDDLLQTEITVKQLSPDELRKRGIVIDARNFDVYEFSFTFIIDGQPVQIPFPVIVDRRTHEVQPVPGESPYVIPNSKLVEPPRWSPPQVIPLDFGEEDGLPEVPAEEHEKAEVAPRPSIPAAIVVPNGLAVLHQFFAVSMMVTNGAPKDSTARVENIRATIKIPTALRTVKTAPEVAFGQPVPIVEPTTKATFLVAQARGEAEWTLEGLTPGTHRIDFDLRATLKQDGQEDIPLRATPSAAIVVHDPRFNVTFSHPEVVRKGNEYSTYAFITNMSATDQSIELANFVEGCDINPGANVCRLNRDKTDLMTIPAGDMRMIEYRLRSNVTGQVFATAGSVSDTSTVQATIKLHMGVSESGIPLSPATLLMPWYAQYVNPEVVSANLQLLGLGYSLATAPLNQMTAKFPRVIKTDVFTRAVDIARAGQRIFITNDAPAAKRDTIAQLALDLLGNGGFELRQWDELRRTEKSGRSAGASVMRELEATGLTADATMATFFDAFASATAHRDAFVAALVHGSATGDRPYALSLTGSTSGLRTDTPNEAAEGWVRGIPFADLSRFNGAGEQGELAIAARWNEELDVTVIPSASGALALDLVYPDSTPGHLLRAHFQLNGTKGEKLTVHIARGAASLNARDANGGIAAVGTISTVNAAPLRLLGARQDMHLDEDGHKVAVLFNRAVQTPEGVDLRENFDGRIDFNRDGVVYKAKRPISGAAIQEDGRVVIVNFDHTLSQNATYTIQAGSMRDPLTGSTVSFPDKVIPTIDNATSAGVVYGHVLKGDGTPLKDVDVRIAQYLPSNPFPYPMGKPQYDKSQDDGAFLFEYVRRQTDADWSGRYRIEAISSQYGQTTLEGIVRQPTHVHFINLQYLGRGAAEGYAKYNDGSVVANADVLVGSTMFNISKSTKTDAEGFYRVDDLPVGPLTFSVQDDAGNVAYAANEVATPGQLVKQNLSIYRQPFPGLGRVYGVLLRADTKAPVAGAHVGVFSQGYGLRDGYTDDQGRFDFTRVPAGFITVLAEDFNTAPQPVAIDLDLRAGEAHAVELLLYPVPDAGTATVVGNVVREKALQPGSYEPAANALVNIKGYKTITADANGNFKFENLPLVLSAHAIAAYDPSTKRIKETVLPTLQSGQTANVSILINAFDRGSGTVRVRLLNAAGVAVSGYRVIEPGFPPVTLSAKGNGIYELPNVRVGSKPHICAVRVAHRTDGKLDPGDKYGDQMACDSAGISFNGQIAPLTLRLPGQGMVRVKLKAQVEGVGSDIKLSYPVWFEGEQHALPETLTASSLTPDGWATFYGIPAISGYEVASAHPQYTNVSAKGALAYDGDIAEHILQMNTLARVRGTVYAIDGVTPVAGASVRISNGHSDPGPQVTGPDGRFEFYDQPSNADISVTAEITQSNVYRIGVGYAATAREGGTVEMSVVLRKRGFVDGRVVYKDYKKYDPKNPANNVPDDTPADYSDNAPVPFAKFHLRELNYPNRTFGTKIDPLPADAAGRFYLTNIFIGDLRATAWDAGNEELRGDWSGSITEEGAEAAPRAYIAIGGGGVGAAEVTVFDPNSSLEIANADVSLSRVGYGAFDTSTTDATGSVTFTDLPVGTYHVSAYSKSVGKSSNIAEIIVTRDTTSHARLRLEFSGRVTGALTDPQASNAGVPGANIRLTASNYATQATTGTAGDFVFEGVREGTFKLDAKDTKTNRRVNPTVTRTLSILDKDLTVPLELEPTATLHFAAYLPDDTGANSGVLAPPQRVEAVQRCYEDLNHVRHCDYERELQGNPVDFPNMFQRSGYGVGIFLAEDGKASIGLGGSFPAGSTSGNISYVYPAYGDVIVRVTQGGQPASGAKVLVSGANKSFTAYTDPTGMVTVRGVRLGGVGVSAISLDEKFSGGASATLLRQSVPVTVDIALGSYAAITGAVDAEFGGPSVGTLVKAVYDGHAAEVRTDETGHYTLGGIPIQGTSGTNIALTFVGPDDKTVGGGITFLVPAGKTLAEVPTVKLDATPPVLESIVPVDGARDVSPDTAIVITFSEPLALSTVNPNTFRLIGTDGAGGVQINLKSETLANGKFAVTMTAPKPATGFPLASNTVYR
ncbi:MAG: Ig-like domain-containing protein, partial [Acidobacteriota bacterium]|nr:Ig-like domain-containing protein [Acidobacteriota bacterium]